jgi:hypothetical protein
MYDFSWKVILVPLVLNISAICACYPIASRVGLTLHNLIFSTGDSHLRTGPFTNVLPS